MFFRDIIHLWGVVLTAWTYATPLFYPIEVLPDLVRTLMQFNPMYQYVTCLLYTSRAEAIAVGIRAASFGEPT